jgi:phosphoglycerate dehydrogenase-like enzyme
MGAALRPGHLLAYAEALAHHLVHHRFDNANVSRSEFLSWCQAGRSLCLVRLGFEGAIMTIDVLALVGVTPERVAALTAAGYAVREGRTYANRIDAVREAGDTVRAVLTNGRGGLSGDEMALLPTLEIVCAVGAGYEAVDLDTARRRGIVVAHCPNANAPAVADSAMMLLMAATRHLLQADRFVRAGGWQDQWRVETPTMTGKRLGTLGLGNIGSRIAQRAARGFDMAIGYHNRAAVAGSVWSKNPNACFSSVCSPAIAYSTS